MHRRGFWFGLFSLLTLALSFSDTALAQLSANPGALTFNVSSGSSQLQTIQITSTTNTTITAGATVGWLSFSPSGPVPISPGSPVTFNVTANATGFSNGSIFITNMLISGASQSAFQIPVTLNVGGTTGGTLSAVPSNLTFSAQAGGAAPASQNVTINNNVSAQAQFTISQTSQNNWLSVSTSQGVTGTATATFTVSVNQLNLPAGTYDGTVNIFSSSGNFNIPVRLTLTNSPTLSVSPAGTLSFFYQLGGTAPPPQSLTLTSTSGAIGYFASTTASGNGTWLVISPAGSGTTDPVSGMATIQVSINTQNLPIGTYSGQITIAPTQTGQAAIQVPISLLVSNNPLIQTSVSAVTFLGNAGGSAPLSQQFQVTSSGSAFSFTTTASSGTSPTTWLSVSPSGGTTGTSTNTITVSANPTGLPAGTYNGTITITSASAANSPRTIPVTLTLSNSLTVVAAPPALTFNFQTNQTPPGPQNIAITSTGQALNYTVSTATTNCGSNWLIAQSQNSQTPGNVIVSVNTAGLVAGAPCQGTVTVTASGQGVQPLVVPITLNVSATALLNVSPTYVAHTVPVGGSLPAQTISVVSTDPNNQIQFDATTTSTGGSWLLVGSGAFTPFPLTYQILPGGLLPGTYTGTITITPRTAGPTPVTVTISLTVQSNTSISAAPVQLTFGQPQGGPAPAPQTVRLSSSSGVLNYSVTAVTNPNQTGGWLSVSPTNGATASDITVTVNGANLAQGTYTGTITVVAPGANNTPLQIPVTLNIAQPQLLTVSPTLLTYNFQIGSTSNPASQTATVTSTGGPATFAAAASVSQPVGGTWLSVAPTSGTTVLASGQYTAALTVAVNPIGLAAGTYNGAISITSPIAGSAVVVTVTLVIQPQAVPSIVSVQNAASNQPGPIAPGEIMAIKGAVLGPVTPVDYTANPPGPLLPTLAGVRVLFDGFPGSPYYVSSTQINVIAPYEIAGRIVTTVVVEYQGQKSAGQTYEVRSVNPGIFTLNSTGSGPGAIVNQDGTINGPPGFTTAYQTIGAPRGSAVAIFATGYGQTDTPSTTGCFTKTDKLYRSALPVTVNIGGIAVTPDFAGAAPLAVCGFMQINITVPQGVPLGQNTVTFTVGGVTSPATATLTVR